MSLFVATRMLRAPLRTTEGLMRAMPFASRAIHTSSKAQALPWAKKAPVVPMTEEQDLKRLNTQRNERPISPHVSIYQPQLTWVSSILHRATGTGMSWALYAYAIGYLAAPHIGLGEMLSSGSLVDAVSHLPAWTKVSVKAPLAAAFMYHFFNGLRHLAWDMGYCTFLFSHVVANRLTTIQSRFSVRRILLVTQ